MYTQRSRGRDRAAAGLCVRFARPPRSSACCLTRSKNSNICARASKLWILSQLRGVVPGSVGNPALRIELLTIVTKGGK
jgi:hypothetical protein